MNHAKIDQKLDLCYNGVNRMRERLNSLTYLKPRMES